MSKRAISGERTNFEVVAIARRDPVTDHLGQLCLCGHLVWLDVCIDWHGLWQEGHGRAWGDGTCCSRQHPHTGTLRSMGSPVIVNHHFGYAR